MYQLLADNLAIGAAPQVLTPLQMPDGDNALVINTVVFRDPGEDGLLLQLHGSDDADNWTLLAQWNLANAGSYLSGPAKPIGTRLVRVTLTGLGGVTTGVAIGLNTANVVVGQATGAFISTEPPTPEQGASLEISYDAHNSGMLSITLGILWSPPSSPTSVTIDLTQGQSGSITVPGTAEYMIITDPTGESAPYESVVVPP